MNDATNTKGNWHRSSIQTHAIQFKQSISLLNWVLYRFHKSNVMRLVSIHMFHLPHVTFWSYYLRNEMKQYTSWVQWSKLILFPCFSKFEYTGKKRLNGNRSNYRCPHQWILQLDKKHINLKLYDIWSHNFVFVCYYQTLLSDLFSHRPYKLCKYTEYL